MNINNFLYKENLNTLWDVISDEDIFKFLSRDIQSKVAELFTNNVKGFFEIEKTNANCTKLYGPYSGRNVDISNKRSK
jgi:hypothetical protein